MLIGKEMAELSNISVLEIVIHLLNLGLVGWALRQYKKWSDLIERSDILWQEYCSGKEIPFRKLGD
jgi:hypothetical protein